MYMGSLIGRIFGVFVNSSLTGMGPAGVYAILGSAAVLSGFTHMTMAITVLLLEVTYDLSLIGPLMLCISIARVISQAINHHGYDEQLILLKKVPFLDEDPPENFDNLVAADLCGQLNYDTLLRSEMPKNRIQMALAAAPDQEQFPVMSQCGTICIGIIPRSRLECLMGKRPMIRRMSRPLAAFPNDATPSANPVREPAVIALCCPPTPTLDIMGDFQADERISPKRGHLVIVDGLMDQTPHTAFEDMPISRLYPLFTRVGVSSICVVSRNGAFKGLITRQELMCTDGSQKKVHICRNNKEAQHAQDPMSLPAKLAESEAKNRALMDEAKVFAAEIEALRKRLHATEEHPLLKPLPVHIDVEPTCEVRLQKKEKKIDVEPTVDATNLERPSRTRISSI
jgi:CBS domain-containing protein